MTAKSAEKQVFAATGREITIGKAQDWLSSRDAAFRAGVNPCKVWACSVYNRETGFLYEPTTIYRTLADLIEDQCMIADNNRAAREIYYQEGNA